MRKIYAVLALVLLLPFKVWGWGEAGHHLIGRQATQIFLSHPLLTDAERKKASAFFTRVIQQGHLGNVPDIHWRNLDGDIEQDGQLLGDATHYIDPEVALPITPQDPDFFKVKVPLDYEQAKATFSAGKTNFDFYHQFATSPWRAQQLTSLFAWQLKNYPTEACAKLTNDTHPTRIALGYAGILAHFVGDMSQPYHTTADYDGVATGQKAIHAFFETDLVEALDEGGLKQKTLKLANQMVQPGGAVERIWARARDVYPDMKPDQEITALILALAEDSYKELYPLQQLDEKFAVATLEEALKMDECKNLKSVAELNAALANATTPEEKRTILQTKVKSPKGGAEKACRRKLTTLVNAEGLPDRSGKPVSSYFEDLIVARLALGTALTADIWARTWKAAGTPALCFTWKYALKPQFVSPTDPNCFGYALKEDPKNFLRKDGTSALPWKRSAESTAQCMSF